jgi:hypothetical protein
MEEREEFRTKEIEASASVDHEPDTQQDKLLWRDKAPLALALAAQSYVVFLWYLHSTHGIHPYVDFVIALAAGIALDWLTVSTVMGRREGRTSIWSWLTSFGAFIGSATIAYDTYAAHWWPIDGKALLHICYPLVVLLYSLHLASPRHNERRSKTHAATSPVIVSPKPRALSNGPDSSTSASDALVVTPTAISAPFTCPSCGAGLERIGELGAAKRWGHCRHCKGSVTVSLTYPVEHSQNGSIPE